MLEIPDGDLQSIDLDTGEAENLMRVGGELFFDGERVLANTLYFPPPLTFEW